MGASNSKTEEDKVLKLCRERKKFVRQALDGRCSLAAAHIMYIQSLRSTGTALRKFIEPEVLFESSLYTSTNATPEPLALIEKSISHFSVSSPSLFHPVDAAENHSPSPSPPSSSRIQAHHMKSRVFSSKKVEEKSPVAVTGTVTSSSTPQNTTPRSTEKHETPQFEDSSVHQDGRQMNHGLGSADDLRQLGEEEGIPGLEDEEEKASILESAETEGSEDEFDDPPAETLVRSFENLNRVNDHVAPSASPTMPSAGSAASATELLNGEKGNSPGLSPLRTPLSAVSISTDKKKTPMKEEQSENKVSPKDFISSIKDIENLFIKASESGKEVQGCSKQINCISVQ
ncbi:nitrate regulatory gene2 protein [Salix suchowensis]|nr:nitrate regulatory gene2 protein [Salix suchowensis]